MGCAVEECECGISKNVEYYENYNAATNRILGGKISDPRELIDYLDVDGDDTIVVSDGILRETLIMIQEISFCDEEVEESDTVICAGGVDHGSTNGDSGGPLLVIRNHRWIQYGVTSLSNNKPAPGDISSYSPHCVYTKVSEYCD
uniref:Peptidase S1 domain-containing protein n=1 Tax=Panagrolaimus sp. ES5 TaxID=591445 RepID=A0AC34F7K6_9BILA